MANVTIKGRESGLEIELSEKATYPTLREELLGKMRKHPTFFKDSDMRVIVRGKILSQAQRKELKRVFAMDFGIHNVLYGDEADHLKKVQRDIQTAQRVAVEPSAPDPEAEKRLVTKVKPKPDSSFIVGTVRNGRRVESVGDVVVIGDVNAGAEISAAGNIAVFGKLAGLAHAGCRGDQEAIIAAVVLAPKQIRIAGHIVSIPAERHRADGPEIAWLDDNGSLKIEPVGNKRR